MEIDKQARLTRAAEQLESVERSARELAAKVRELGGDATAKTLASRIEKKLRTAHALLADSDSAPIDDRFTSRHAYQNLIADILVDIGCLRVTSRSLAAAATTS